MQITDVRVRKIFEEGPMKAIVSVTFDNELALHDVKVINAREKFFVVMPSRKNPDYDAITCTFRFTFRLYLHKNGN